MRSALIPARSWLAILCTLVGCYDVVVVGLPGPPPPRRLFPNQPPVPVAEYATLLLLPSGDPVLVITRGPDHEVISGCGLDDPGFWSEGTASEMSAMQFPIDIIRDDSGLDVEVSRVCVVAVSSCEPYDRCIGLTNEFGVRRGEACVKADPGTYFVFYKLSGAKWNTVTGTATADIRCRLALQLTN